MTLSPEDLEDLGLEPEAENVIKLPPVKRRPFQPWTLEDIENMPELQWLIGNDDNPVLLEGALWQTIGLLKSAKTFYTLEQAFCIAFGVPFHGLQTKQGQVIYILAEGGIKRNFKRVRALFDKHQAEMAERGFETLADAMASNQLLLVDQTIKLANSQPAEPTSPESFIKELKSVAPKPALIILDTWARALWESGGHDSDQQSVGPSIQSLEMIRKTFGGCTLIMVAHIGASKEAQGRAKGLTDPAGAIDGGTLCRETGKGSGVFTFKAIYQRHAAEGFTITAQLQKPLETSASVALVSGGGAVGAINIAQAAPSTRGWLDALVSLGTGSATALEWQAAAVARGVVIGEGGQPPKADSVRKAMRRAREELVELRAITVSPDNRTVTLTAEDMIEPERPGEFDEDDEAEAVG
jgi:AAA domain